MFLVSCRHNSGVMLHTYYCPQLERVSHLCLVSSQGIGEVICACLRLSRVIIEYCYKLDPHNSFQSFAFLKKFLMR